VGSITAAPSEAEPRLGGNFVPNWQAVPKQARQGSPVIALFGGAGGLGDEAARRVETMVAPAVVGAACGRRPYDASMGATRWPEYLNGFHADRPGITEAVLSRARHEPTGDPYDWLLAAVPPSGLVLDVACGSAPLRPRLPHRAYLGVDASAAELAAAHGRGAPLVRASATALPVAAAGVEVVVCSMALPVLTPLPAALAEIRRVLAPGGRMVAILPARRPLHPGDLPVLAGLLGALGRGLTYPNDRALTRLPALLETAGLRLETDQRRRFAYPLRSPADADRFLASLYLPDLSAGRRHAAASYLRTLARARVRLPVPIRRVVATPADRSLW
jgi:SAM-dependent methyltransferase